MKTGIILNILICLIIFGSTFFTARYVFRYYRKNKVDLSFAVFWFFVSLTWLSVALSLYFYLRGSVAKDVLTNQYIVQLFVYSQVIAGGYYGSYRAFRKEKISFAVLIIYAVLSLIAIYYVYLPGGLTHRESTYFSDEFNINIISWTLFVVMAVPAILCVVFDLIRSTFFWLAQKKSQESRYTLAGLAIVSYGVIGFFDNQGYLATWLMVLLRLLMIFSALSAYLAYSKRYQAKEIKAV